MKLTIKQLLEMHDAMTKALDALDDMRTGPRHGFDPWHDLFKARSIVRSAIESTAATVDIEDAT